MANKKRREVMKRQALLLILQCILILISPSCRTTTNAAVTFPIPGQSGPDSALVANFTHSPKDVVVGRPVAFSDHSTGPITFWEWDFGDGTFANATSPQDASKMHTYMSVGEMDVRLSVFDNQSNNNSTFAALNVRKINTVLSLGNTTVTQDSTVVLTATLIDEFGDPVEDGGVNFFLIGTQGQQLIGSAYTDSIGRATIYYEPSGSEAFQVNAVFDGTTMYAGAASQTQTFQIGISFLPYAVVASIAVIFMSIILAYLRWRSRKALSAGEEPASLEKK